MADPAATRLTGLLDLERLERAVSDGAIETVVTALPDLYGRLVGKRINARFFLDEIAHHGMHVCDYLLACDMEMDPTPGYAFASWKTGYGDLRAAPDLGTLRVASWLDRTAIVLCDAFDADDQRIAVAPRTILQRQLERAARLGFSAKTGSELEFFLFDDTYREARERGYRNLRTSQDYVEDTLKTRHREVRDSMPQNLS